MINFNAISFFLKETIIGLKRSSLMTLIAVATVSITLIILGLFMLISVNLGKVTQDIVSKLEIRLFLKQNLTIEDIQLFRRKLKAIDGVKDVVFINNSTAWNSFQENYSHLNLNEYITENPLPHSLNIKIKRTKDLKPILLYIKRFDTIIDDIVYGGELADRVTIFRRVMFVAGWSLIVLLVFASFSLL